MTVSPTPATSPGFERCGGCSGSPGLRRPIRFPAIRQVRIGARWPGSPRCPCRGEDRRSDRAECVGRAKALGDAIDAEREEREARLRDAGFEEPDAEQRRANLATNVALMEWPSRFPGRRLK